MCDKKKSEKIVSKSYVVLIAILSFMLMACYVLYVIYAYWSLPCIKHIINILIAFLFGFSLIVPTILIILKYRSLPSVDDVLTEEAKEKIKSNFVVGLVIHIIPFFILSMALLLQLEKVTAGGPDGLAAISAIMILFMLAELGAAGVSIVQDMKSKTEELKVGLDNASISIRNLEKSVKDIGFVQAFTGLMDAFVNPINDKDNDIKGKPAHRLTIDLINSYTSILAKRGSKGSILPTLLKEYMDEEIKDLTANLCKAKVPIGVWPWGTSFKKKEGERQKVFFLAINVGFYAELVTKLLERIIFDLVGSQGKRPCLATVTNALPSHFFNWPLKDPEGKRIKGRIYMPLADYGVRLSEAVRHQDNPAAIYRLVLTCEENTSNYDLSSLILPLWSKERFDYECHWHFYCSGKGKPTISKISKLQDGMKEHYNSIYRNYDEADPPNFQVSSTKDKFKNIYYDHQANDDLLFLVFGPEENLFRDHQCPFRPDLNKFNHDAFKNGNCINVMKYFSEVMHPAISNTPYGMFSGFTEVQKVSKEDFLGEGDSFSGRPDILFIGACNDSINNIWEDEDGDGWDTVIMATMSPESETMFLCVIYDEDLIKDLWKQTRIARNHNKNIGKTIGSAIQGEWVYKTPEEYIAAANAAQPKPVEEGDKQ